MDFPAKDTGGHVFYVGLTITKIIQNEPAVYVS